jgi:hypothetical protein
MNINTHRSCAPKTIKLFVFPIFWFWATWWRLFQKRSCSLNVISTFLLGEYGLTLLGMLDFCFVSAVIYPSLLIGVTSVLSVSKDFIYNSFFHHILLKVFTVESQDNIPDCTNTHIKTALPISLPGVKETPT